MGAVQRLQLEGASANIYRIAPSWENNRTLAIGAIEFPSLEAGRGLLSKVEYIAREEGLGAILGPLDGDTWHSYRLVYESDGRPPFIMEPTSGEFDLPAFENAGFSPVSFYASSIASISESIGRQKPCMDGITVEPWDGENGGALIRDMFNLSMKSFANNKFFSPISYAAFLEIYEPLLPFIQKEHVLFAINEEGNLKGYLFGTPDFLDQTDCRAIILKTYASTVRGVGYLLADRFHRRAADMGYKSVIHALMHDENVSLDRSKKHKARVFRRYALMGKSV